MRKPMGIDLSLTSTGFSFDGVTRTVTSAKKGVRRLVELTEQIEELVRAAEPDSFACIEGYSFASRNSQAHALGELGGVVRVMLYKNGRAVVEIPPTCRAKFATGRGNASKSEVISAVSARTRMTWHGKGADDEIDAYILEEMGLAYQGAPRHSWPQINMEALAKVDWSPLATTEE